MSNANISLHDDKRENERNLFFLAALMLTPGPASYQLPEESFNSSVKINK
jgi:hypothetical protein